MWFVKAFHIEGFAFVARGECQYPDVSLCVFVYYWAGGVIVEVVKGFEAPGGEKFLEVFREDDFVHKIFLYNAFAET